MASYILPWARPLAKRAVKLAPGLGGTLVTREIQHIRTIDDKTVQTPQWLTDNTRERYIAEFESVKAKNKEYERWRAIISLALLIDTAILAIGFFLKLFASLTQVVRDDES